MSDLVSDLREQGVEPVPRGHEQVGDLMLAPHRPGDVAPSHWTVNGEVRWKTVTVAGECWPFPEAVAVRPIRRRA